jgi:hypothetical protein
VTGRTNIGHRVENSSEVYIPSFIPTISIFSVFTNLDSEIVYHIKW